MIAVVRVEGVTKYYGRQRAVHDVSFEIARGEVLGLLGPNGSGKTTILRIITGYLNASAGRVTVAGHDLVDEGLEARRHIGYVPEDAPLYPHMRVAEALEFMGRLKGLVGPALDTALVEVKEQLTLQSVWSRAIGKLSRGYRQRVAIAQALLNRPALLVLDEPTNGLDPRQIIELRELIRRLAEHHAILVTSHILAEMERVATRVLILLDGELLASHSLRLDDTVPAKASRVRVDDADPARVVACLAAVPGVTAVHAPVVVTQHIHDYRVMLDATCSPADIAASLVAGGFRLNALADSSDVNRDLEAIFLDLTGKRHQ